MSKRLIFLILPIVIISGSLTFLGVKLLKDYQTPGQPTAVKKNAPKDVHYHAGFQVYVNGVLQDFSGNEYMHETPCTVDGKPIEDAHGDEQTEKAHLHDHTGDVVHVHREEALWGDLFLNIGYVLPEDQTMTIFAHGKKVNNISEYPIIPNDSVVILIGEYENPEDYLKNAITRERIIEVEQKSETCAS